MNLRPIRLLRALFAVISLNLANSLVWSEIDPLIELDRYVVTANRMPSDVADVSQSIEVISAEQVQLVSASFGTDLLKKTSSVDVIQYPGGTSGVSVRGFRPLFSNETNPHTLLLLNGRPVSASLGNIATNNIARIEVLKGPASAIYGPSAMGGVINIITNQRVGALSGSAFAGYGSYQTAVAGVAAGGSLTEKLSFDVSLDWIERGDDYQFGDGDAYEVGADGKNTYLHTQFSRLNGLAQLGYQLNEAWKLSLLFDFSDQSKTGVPGPLSNQKFDASNPSVRDLWREGWSVDVHGVMDRHQLAAKLYSNKLDAFQHYSMDSFTRSFCGRTNDKDIAEWGVQLSDVWSLHEQSDLVFGLDHGFQEEINVSRNADGSVRSFHNPDYDRTKTGIYVESVTRTFNETVVVNVGARVDRIATTVEASTYEGTSYLYAGGSQTFEQCSPRAGVVWKITSDWRLHSSIGTAFVAPNAREVAGFYETEYASYVRIHMGNPDLDPESSLTWDLGLEYRTERFTFDVTWFQTKVEDYIISLDTGVRDTGGENNKQRQIFSYVNADSQKMRGVEFTGTVEVSDILDSIPGQLRLSVNGTYMDLAEVRSGSYTEPVKNIADWKGNVTLIWRLGELTTRFNSRYNGKRWDIDYTYDKFYGGVWYEYPDYWVFDWSISWRFLTRHKVTLLVDNLFDAYYYEKLDYPVEGCNFMLRYEWEF